VFPGPTGVRGAELRLPLLSKTGAVCGSAARTDLRGGRPAMTVPTATTTFPGFSVGRAEFTQALEQRTLRRLTPGQGGRPPKSAGKPGTLPVPHFLRPKPAT